MALEDNIIKILEDRNISLLWLSKQADIGYMQLYDSLMNKSRERKLRADEFMAICEVLEEKAEDLYKN
jgi:DNA-binding Xre family transcriptional regulator